MRHLIIILLASFTLSGFGQISEFFLGQHVDSLKKDGLISNVWRQTPWVQTGYAIWDIQGVEFKLECHINNDGYVYWVEGISNTYESREKLISIVEYWVNLYNTESTHKVGYGRTNLGKWMIATDKDHYNIYEAMHDNPDKPMQIEISVTRSEIAHNPSDHLSPVL